MTFTLALASGRHFRAPGMSLWLKGPLTSCPCQTQTSIHRDGFQCSGMSCVDRAGIRYAIEHDAFHAQDWEPEKTMEEFASDSLLILEKLGLSLEKPSSVSPAGVLSYRSELLPGQGGIPAGGP